MKVLFCYLKGCEKCGGDLVHDDGDWRCWQCGEYYYSSRRAGAGDTPAESLAGCPASAPRDCFSPYQAEPGRASTRRRGRTQEETPQGLRSTVHQEHQRGDPGQVGQR